MKLSLSLLILLLPCVNTSAQEDVMKELDTITTTESANKYLKRNRGNNRIITFNEEKHKSELAREVLNMNLGGSKVIRNEIEDIHYKVIDKKEITYYRVNYIMLDGTRMNISDIKNLRPQLISEIKAGTSINTLANRYSMDNNRNRGGDSGWITFGDMLPEFEQQVMNDDHNVDDVFTVDVISNRWYYVVKKTHEKKSITEVKVLKVVESKK